MFQIKFCKSGVSCKRISKNWCPKISKLISYNYRYYHLLSWKKCFKNYQKYQERWEKCWKISLAKEGIWPFLKWNWIDPKSPYWDDLKYNPTAFSSNPPYPLGPIHCISKKWMKANNNNNNNNKPEDFCRDTILGWNG